MEEIEIIQPDKLKDVLITRTAIKTMVSEKIVEKVISFQFEELYERMKDQNLISLPTFGTFKLGKKSLLKKKLKLKNEMNKLKLKCDDEPMRKVVRRNVEGKIQELQKEIDFIEERLCK